MADEIKDLNVAEFTQGIRERVGENSGLDAVIKFAFDEGGVIFIDGKSVPNVVSNEDLPAEVTLKMSLDTMNKLYRKETNGMMAFMSGKIKLDGNMMAAMKLDQVLG
jgi:putative sterol carrier protein